NLDVNRVRPFVVRQDRLNPNLMYLGTNVGLFSSLDRGETWTQVVAPKPPAPPKTKRTAKKTGKGIASSTAKKVTPPVAPVSTEPALLPAITEKIKTIELLPGTNRGMLVGTDRGLYRSFDLTKGWEKLTFAAGMNENVFAIHINPARPETIWA